MVKFQKNSWEYLNETSIIIEHNGESTLLKHAFLDSHILALKIDGSDGCFFL